MYPSRTALSYMEMEKLRQLVIDSVLKTQSIVQSVDRFDDLITKWLPAMIYEQCSIDTVYEDDATKKKYRFVSEVSNYRAIRQQLTPDECCWRNMNYAFDCVVDLKLTVSCDGVVFPPEYEKDFILFSCPAMLHSKMCVMSDGCDSQTPIEYEMGSSFILRGKRRFIPLMQRLYYNQPFLCRYKNMFRCEVRSEHLDKPHRSTSTLALDILPAKKGKLLGRGNIVNVTIPYLKPKVPTHVLVLALGFTFKEFELCVYQMDEDPDYLRNLIGPYVSRMYHAHDNCFTREDALNRIADLSQRTNATPEGRLRSVTNTIFSEILPNLNHTFADERGTNLLKLRVLAFFTGLVYRFSEGLIPATNRDSYENICFDGPAELMAQLIRMVLLNFNRDSVRSIRRILKQNTKKSGTIPSSDVKKPVHERITLAKIYNSSRITPRLMTAVSTGRWSEDKDGVSQPIKTTNSRLNASQLQKVSSSLSHNPGKHVDPRMIGESSYGYICAAESPDGEKCGLIYTLAQTCMITNDSDGDVLMNMIIHFEWKDLFVPIESISIDESAVSSDWWKVVGPFGVIHGWVKDVEKAVRRVRTLRRNLSIDPFTSIYIVPAYKSVYIRTTAGRAVRPLLVLENVHKLDGIVTRLRGNVHRLLHTLLQHGVVEYLDPAEILSSMYVALSPKSIQPFHTHLELGDMVFLGRLASQMNHCRYNQGPRLVYEINMAKQYISPLAADDYAANTTHFLHYGQAPLVRTVYEEEDQCDGLNCILAFIPHPNSQEDAMVFKKGFVDRGAFHSSSIRTHSATHTPRNPSQPQDKFERPSKRTFGMRIGDYSKVEEDTGLPLPGTKLLSTDIVIGKTIPHSHVSDSSKVKVPAQFHSADYHEYRRDASVQLRKDEAGTVHETIEAPGMKKARVRTFRTVCQGDKYSNRHGQKGTVGKIESDENMPFNPVTGMIPDIIVGPTALPSRMTLGYLLEMCLGKAVAASAILELGVEDPEFSIETTEKTIERVQKVLMKHGYHHSGREMLCDGITGNMLHCQIMMGPVWTGKMDHLVSKKVHARARGPTQPITWQPLEGRRNDGGFRLGSMEIDVLAAHGSSQILKERSTGVSDEIVMYACKQCGFPADANPDIGLYMCRYCGTRAHVRMVKQSKSATVMFTELAADGIKTQMILNDLPEIFQNSSKRRRVERIEAISE